MLIVRRLFPGIIAGTLLAGSVSGVLAAKATPKATWTALSGQVTNLSGSTFTLNLNPKAAAAGKTAKTVQVTIATTAKQQARPGTTGTLAGGDYAIVVGPRTAASVNATRIIYSATAFKSARMVAGIRARHTLYVLSHHTLRGTVASSTGTSLVITVKGTTTRMVQITSATIFRVNGQLSSAAPTFSTGEKVTVVFTVDKTTKQLMATVVTVRA